MRERRGSFEVVLTDGQRNVLDEPEGGASYIERCRSTRSSWRASNAPLRASDAEQLVGSIASTVPT